MVGFGRSKDIPPVRSRIGFLLFMLAKLKNKKYYSLVWFIRNQTKTCISVLAAGANGRCGTIEYDFRLRRVTKK
jgi:hypothetical protein